MEDLAFWDKVVVNEKGDPNDGRTGMVADYMKGATADMMMSGRRVPGVLVRFEPTELLPMKTRWYRLENLERVEDDQES